MTFSTNKQTKPADVYELIVCVSYQSLKNSRPRPQKVAICGSGANVLFIIPP